MIKVVLVSLLVVAAALIYVPVRQLIGVGHVLSSYGNENTESCRLVEHPLLRGCEDGELHAETGTIFFACAINLADRSGWFPPLELANRSVVGSGGIVAFDTKTLTPRRLAFESHDGEFTPHGIGLLPDPADAGKLIVHAVNHRRDGSVVDMFEHTLGSTTLLRIGTARNARLLASPNDVQPVGRTAFYATNDLATHGFLRQIEMLLSLRWSHVTYFERRGGADDTGAAAGGIDKWIVAAEHLAYPNGIARSADGEHIYVSQSSGEMRVFKPRKSHTLKMLGELKLPFSVDNIALDAQSGDFYLTGFGNILGWREHVHDHSAKSPSAIIRVSHNTEQDQYYGRRYRVERLMVEDGSKASGATVAIPDQATQRLFIGGVFMHGILVCNLPPRK